MAASPNVQPDDPLSSQIGRLRAVGLLPPASGGLRATPAAAATRPPGAAGSEAGSTAASLPTDAWTRPLELITGRVQLHREHARSYSTSYRPRDLVGALALSCEHAAGRPCGDGVGFLTELDSSAGYGRWVHAFTRVRAMAGTGAYPADLALDRAYVSAELGPVALEVGRDIIVLGPSARTQLAWGDNAPPLDHVRLSTSRPYNLLGEGGDKLRGNLLYFLGRLRAPQTYPGNLVSVGRIQLDVMNRVEVGMSQLLQLGGDGAPSIGAWDFLAEHFRRRDMSASETDSSNRRVSFDVSAMGPRLGGARFYYELVFEDWRRQFGDALRFDADHLVGVEFAALGPGRRHGLVVELHKTGVRSHEHSPRVTGMTNAGRIVGSPLGPDAQSAFGGGRIELGWATLQPWLEVARLSSDTYELVEDAGISRVGEGVNEFRYRGGGRLSLPIERGLRVEVEAAFEHVSAADFVPGARRENFGGAISLVWRPDFVIGRAPALAGER